LAMSTIHPKWPDKTADRWLAPDVLIARDSADDEEEEDEEEEEDDEPEDEDEDSEDESDGYSE
jgi:hypothetical protein